MEWNNEDALLLINEYRKQPVLWNAAHGFYTSKAKKQEAWETIAYNIQLDVSEVRQKMNSLLGSFRREKSRTKRSLAAAKDSPGGQHYVSKWFAFDSMKFLLSRKYPQIDMNADNTLQLKFEAEEAMLEDCSSDLINEEPESMSPQTIVKTEVQPTFPVPTPTPPRPKRLKKNPTPIEELRLEEEFPLFPLQDECSTYGQHIANKLRKYSSRTRAFVEHAINNVLFDADMGRYDRAPSPYGSSEARKSNFPVAARSSFVGEDVTEPESPAVSELNSPNSSPGHSVDVP